MGAMFALYEPPGGGQQFQSRDSGEILGVGEASDWFGLVNQ